MYISGILERLRTLKDVNESLSTIRNSDIKKTTNYTVVATIAMTSQPCFELIYHVLFYC